MGQSKWNEKLLHVLEVTKHYDMDMMTMFTGNSSASEDYENRLEVMKTEVDCRSGK